MGSSAELTVFLRGRFPNLPPRWNSVEFRVHVGKGSVGDIWASGRPESGGVCWVVHVDGRVRGHVVCHAKLVSVSKSITISLDGEESNRHERLKILRPNGLPVESARRMERKEITA